MNHAEGYFFSPERIEGFPGRAFELIEVWPYRLKEIKKQLKKLGLKKLNLSRRYFDVPIAKIRDGLRIAEGGKEYLLFTRLSGGERVALLARRLR